MTPNFMTPNFLYIYELSYREVGARFGYSHDTANQNVKRLKRALIDSLEIVEAD